MSGHSKWAKIKHQKGVNDAKKGMIFTKLAKNITLAAKEGGGDLNMNFILRLAVSKAKDVNMPSENIERAIKKGVGGDEKSNVQRVSYEAMLGNVGLIVDCQTDNPNRTVAEVKHILEGNGAKMVGQGSISWNFEEKGIVTVRPQKVVKSEKYGAPDSFADVDRETLELELMDIEGVEDLEEGTGYDEENSQNYSTIEIYTNKTALKNVSTEVEKRGYRVETFSLIKLPKEKKVVSEEEGNKAQNLVELLEENDDVDEVWLNI